MRVKKESARATKDNIEASPASMPSMRAANSRDPRRMARGAQPIMNGRANAAAGDGRITRSMMTGDQEDDTVSRRNRAIELVVDRLPGAVERHAMKVDDTVGLQCPRAQLLVPAAVERGGGMRTRSRLCVGNVGRSMKLFRLGRCRTFGARISSLSVLRVARKRPDGCGYPRPERLLFRAERAHGRQRPWGAESTPVRKQTSRPQSASPLHRLPNKYRTDWAP